MGVFFQRLIREIKKSSNEFIHSGKFTQYKFSWQGGFGAFSYSHSAFDNVVSYINRQKEHHKKQTFHDEYKEFLTRYKIDYKYEYIFEWIK